MTRAMKLAKQGTTDLSTVFWPLLLILMGYRHEMPIAEVMIFSSFSGETGYYVCPRCHITMEREFMAFCDRCGQHLGWKNYKRARKVYPGHHNTVHT